MYIKVMHFPFIYLLIIIKYSYCFIALPFGTIFIRNNSVSPANDYRAQMLQNELYINLTLGTPKQVVTSIIKMDLNGFVIYNGSFNRNNSSSYNLLDEERRLTCFPQIKSYTSEDYFYLPSLDSYTDFNNIVSKKESIDSKIIKTEKSQFIWAIKLKDSMTKFNDIYENYGIIGLKIYYSKYFIAPEFVFSSFKGLTHMKNHNFYLRFDDNKINGFFNSNNTGYFIFGEEIVDDENERNNIKYTKARERVDTVNWDLAFDDVVSTSKENETIEYRPEYKHAEFYVNFPYILGPRDYGAFIRKVFFQELLIKRVCDYSDKINGEEYIGYMCDSRSELFMEKLNTTFPDLIFEHKELEEKFIFTKNDLFTYNIYNKSDPYLYFIVLFPQLKDKYHVMSWIMGVPFLKKYILSFNFDNKMIGYYKPNANNTYKKSNFFLFEKENIVIIVFILAVILAFVFGMYTHKKIAKVQRKNKANELDDSFEYEPKNGKEDKEDDKEVVDSINDDKNSKVELSNKLIK